MYPGCFFIQFASFSRALSKAECQLPPLETHSQGLLVTPLYPVAERSEHFGRVGEVEALGFSFRKLVQLTALIV